MSRLRLYIATVIHLKPSQVTYRIWRRLGGKTPLRPGYVPKPDPTKTDSTFIPTLPELDFDSVVLARFDADALLNDRVELLHHEEYVDWCGSWHAGLSTPLWRFNLHYHEYLLSLAKAFLDSGDTCYLDKAMAIISSWIDACPKEKGGIAWDPYVISMRTVNWLAFLGELSGALTDATTFITRVNISLAEQYVHLSRHLEKDLLANHYLENLKALVILACYFGDDKTLEMALPAFRDQVDSQILPDGLHLELSPMYHKIVLEDLLRVISFLETRGRSAKELADCFRLQDMCNALYSLERNTNRTPLFNDSGDNVAKCCESLLVCARSLLGIIPVYKNSLSDSGYAVLERETPVGTVKVIFDAGMPGPCYAMGHVHCDALSIEVFINGKPWIVNGGTYAYQDERRLDYKCTLSHSALRVGGAEQHECWAPFRVAGHSLARLIECDGRRAEGILTQRGVGAKARRKVELEEDGILVRDEVDPACGLEAAFIFARDTPRIEGAWDCVHYAPEFGYSRLADRIVVKADKGLLETWLPYPAPARGGVQ